MNKRVQWRAVMLVTMATIAFGLSVRSYAATTPTAAAGPTIERYNPFVAGNRLVFTQVERQADDSTTSAVWARDLVTGRETLVADVVTGEAMPVTNARWTAWTEMASDTHVRVRARANSGGPVIDVFTTAASMFGPFETDPNALLTNVALDGDRLITTNGRITDGTVPELVRFDLPRARPQYVDVESSNINLGASRLLIDAAGGTIAVAETFGQPSRLSVLDANGRTASSVTTCGAGARDTSKPATDGRRVVQGVVCADGAFVATCVVPCSSATFIPVGGFGNGAPQVALSGNKVAFSTTAGFGFGNSDVMILDLTTGGPPVSIRTTSAAIGPRVSMSDGRVAWDEFDGQDGVLGSSIFVYELATGSTTVIRGDGSTRRLGTPGPIRLEPDVRGQTIVYNELPGNGSSGGIWTRSLSGRASLVSIAATDGSVPRIGSSHVAFTTLDPSTGRPEVVAARTDGRGPLLDVVTTVADATEREGMASVHLDMDGDRAIVSMFMTDQPFFFPPRTVLTRNLPNGVLTQLTPTGPFDSPIDEQGAEGDAGRTAAIATPSFGFGASVVALYGPAGSRQVLDGDPAGGCPFRYTGVSTRVLVGYSECNDDHSPLRWCAMPCANGFTDVRTLGPAGTWQATSFSAVTAMAVSGTKVVLLRSSFVNGGRYRSSRQRGVLSVELVDLTSANPPRLLDVATGRVSAPRIDGDTVVWSVDRIDGSRTGTVWVYDVRTGTRRSL